MALSVRFQTTNSPLYFCPGIRVSFSEVGAVPMDMLEAYVGLERKKRNPNTIGKTNSILYLLNEANLLFLIRLVVTTTHEYDAF